MSKEPDHVEVDVTMRITTTTLGLEQTISMGHLLTFKDDLVSRFEWFRGRDESFGAAGFAPED